MSFVRFVVVVGLSGAGKSQAMKSFEDLDFHCVDNLPPALLDEFVDLAQSAGTERLSLSLDVHTGGRYGAALEALDAVKARGISYELLFLDASDLTIVRRYSETRRRHPFGSGTALLEAISRERADLQPLRNRADRVWDTSDSTLGSLKARIASTYATAPAEHALSVALVAFGYKFGLPADADLVFDVRFLPNPNYVDELRPLTGNDPQVAAFLASLPDVSAFLAKLFDFVDFLLPRFRDEGKSRLTIAVGCTGGRHRSVYIAGRLAEHLRDNPDVRVLVENRELAAA